MSDDSVAGLAALTICESLLLALNDRNVMPQKEIMGVLADAATALDGNDKENSHGADTASAAALIRKIIAGGNSVRRPSSATGIGVTLTKGS